VNHPVHLNKTAPILKASLYVLLEIRAGLLTDLKKNLNDL
jgi:hypothetical protein